MSQPRTGFAASRRKAKPTVIAGLDHAEAAEETVLVVHRGRNMVFRSPEALGEAIDQFRRFTPSEVLVGGILIGMSLGLIAARGFA